MTDLDLQAAVGGLLLRQRFRASQVGIEAHAKANAILDQAFKEWSIEHDRVEQRDKRLDDERRAVIAARPRTYPTPRRAPLQVMPPRGRQAKSYDDALRLLKQPPHRMERYVWDVTVLGVEHDGGQCFWGDMLDDFKEWSVWQAERDKEAREAQLRVKFARKVATRAQSIFANMAVPVEMEIVGDTVFWRYAAGPVSHWEAEFIHNTLATAVPRDLGRYSPARPDTPHPEIHQGFLELTATAAQLRSSFPYEAW